MKYANEQIHQRQRPNSYLDTLFLLILVLPVCNSDYITRSYHLEGICFSQVFITVYFVIIIICIDLAIWSKCHLLKGKYRYSWYILFVQVFCVQIYSHAFNQLWNSFIILFVTCYPVRPKSSIVNWLSGRKLRLYDLPIESS